MTKQTFTSHDYKVAAEANLFFAKMDRLYGRTESSQAHYGLADLYIKQELRRAAEKRAS